METSGTLPFHQSAASTDHVSIIPSSNRLAFWHSGTELSNIHTRSLFSQSTITPEINLPSKSIAPFERDGISVVKAIHLGDVGGDWDDNFPPSRGSLQLIVHPRAINKTASSQNISHGEAIDSLTGLPKGDSKLHPSSSTRSAPLEKQPDTKSAEDLLAPLTDPPLPRTSALTATSVPYPGYPFRYEPGKALRYDANVRQWQQRMSDRGWTILVDGFYGSQSQQIARQFQREKGLTADGIVGRKTWEATFRDDNVAAPLPDQPQPPAPPNPPGTPVGGTAQINQEGLNLVKNFEGFRAKAYRDPVGIWTIGYGHTGPDVRAGRVITRAEGEALLRQDLRRFENHVRRLVKVPLTSNQFSALVSFTYNVGPGSLAESTLLRLLNRSDYQGAANQFPRWNRAGGKVLPGLVRRRSAEKVLFLKPDGVLA